jgi:hypothetical protein
MDYNTTRNKLVLPEYGRNIQKMVNYAVEIEDREERNRVAAAIIQIMGNIKPQYREISDFKHKLWDHLAIISDFKLDIDFPYEVPKKETFYQKPRPVPYPINNPRYKHYGSTIEKLIQTAVEMEHGDEREELIRVIANHMKKLFLTWNKDSVTDDVIFSDLKELSGGKLDVEKDLKLSETRDILSKTRKKRVIRKK